MKIPMQQRIQRGVSLIEVLVSVTVLGLGVMGAVAMQMNALKFNQTSLDRSQATFAASDMLDRMRSNLTAARAGGYNVAVGDGAPAGATIAAADIREWRGYLDDLLPAGAGGVNVQNGVATVTITWDERRSENSADAVMQSFVYTVEL